MSQSSRKFPQSTFLVQQPDGQLTSEQALSILDAGLLEVLDSPDGTVASVTKPAGDIVGTSAIQTLTNKTIDASSNTITFGHTDLTSGTGTNTHAEIDTHIAATGDSVHGLGTISTQNSDAVSITGGTIAGITDLAVADGGTGASTAADARTNLGLVIASHVQGWSAILDDLAGLTQLADKGFYFNTDTTAATFDFTAAGRALLDDADNEAQRTTLGLGDSATKNTGTASGEVAEGDHHHDSAYLNVTNTSAYTPTQDHHPATKKYVDDNDEGESNTASNVGAAGVGIFKQKTSLDLEFKKLNAGSTKVTITDDTDNNEVDIDIDQTTIDHDSLLNYVAAQHRVIDDTAGDGDTTVLWSADKIFDQLATKSDTHSHPYLEIADNLSDLNNAETARTNLGLGTAAVKDYDDPWFNAIELRSKTIKDETPNVNGQVLTFTDDDTHADDQKWKLWTYGLPQGASTAGYVLKAPASGNVLEWAADSLRTITAGGNTLADSESLAFTAGTGIDITEAGGEVTITNTVTDTTYNAATSSVLGLMKLEDDTEQSVAANAVSATASRTYGVQFNSSNQAVVNVPWVDTDEDTWIENSNTAAGYVASGSGQNSKVWKTDSSGNPAWRDAALMDSIIDADSDTKIQVEASTDEDKIRFNTAGSERMIIDDAGNVGIGVTDPDAELEINGQVKITDGTQGADKVLTSDANGLATWETSSGSGHTIQDEGVDISPQRGKLNFAGELVRAADDGSDSTDVTIDAKTLWLYAA